VKGEFPVECQSEMPVSLFPHEIRDTIRPAQEKPMMRSREWGWITLHTHLQPCKAKWNETLYVIALLPISNPNFSGITFCNHQWNAILVQEFT
ncbi:hypothetical protein PV327_009949, partial [Microctonus hyperodae]